MIERQLKSSVSIILIRILLKYAESIGIKSAEICKAADLNPSILKNSQTRVSSKQFRVIWETAVAKTGDENFGLNFGKAIAQNFPGGHILYNVMMNCPTVREAAEKFIQYNSLMADAVQPRIGQEGDFVYLTFSNSNNKYKIPRHISEALLSSYVHIFRNLTENRLKLVEVSFKHARPEDITRHEQIFQAPLLFEQPSDELVIAKEFLDLPIFLANPGILKPLEQIAQKFVDNLYLSDSLSDRVARLLSKLLSRGERINIETIAASLAMSVRNLQIKLKEEGTSYQKILDSVRKEIALSYLNEDDVTICDVAFLLGFSEQSAFNHAFKRWTGGSPKTYYKKKQR
jgi:AraC-like DNA-binding protein